MVISAKYGYNPQPDMIAGSLQAIASNLDTLESVEILKNCFSMMDLTTLHPQDTEESVRNLVKKANEVPAMFNGYPLPASVCVFPNFASVVAKSRVSTDLHVTAVAACFPNSQSFKEVKILECVMAVRKGADEVDVVLPLNLFFAGDYKGVLDELCSIREAVDKEAGKRKIVLKVILETGVLSTPEKIADAAFLAMEAGADFIKTSTGKVEVNATPMAAYVMCECISKYYASTGRKVGFKAAGGISNSRDALSYYMIVSSVLGAEWLCKDLFRFGVSKLGNNLISAIEQRTVKYF